MPILKSKLKKPPGRIYVVQSLGHLKDLVPGTKSWWCVEQSALPGEICAMYIKSKGIALLFRYQGTAIKHEIFCRMHEMATGEIEILGKRTEPFSAQDMREHRALKTLPALMRSFQSRSFRLDEPYLTEVEKLFGWMPERSAKSVKSADKEPTAK